MTRLDHTVIPSQALVALTTHIVGKGQPFMTLAE